MIRMKYIVYIVLLAGIFSCNSPKTALSFEVEGVIKNSSAHMAYLEEVIPNNNNPIIVDSAALNTDGSFSLKAKAKEEGLYQLRLQGKVTPFALFINDAGKIKINADLNNTTQPYTVEGSAATEALVNFDKTLSEQGMSIVNQGNKVDSLKRINAADSLINIEYSKLETLVGSLKKYALDFINKSNSPILTLYALGSYQNSMTNIGLSGLSRVEVVEIVTNAGTKFPNHEALQNVKKSLPPLKAPDFTQPDVNGKLVSLSQFKGKYVLVDFWASWCRPCRIDNPNVVKAYNEFKDKNFTILGVSLDQNKDAWLQAIQQDGLIWTHVSDLQYWNNAAAALYNVTGIPYNVLVDPNGNIIAENLHGEEIVEALRKLVK